MDARLFALVGDVGAPGVPDDGDLVADRQRRLRVDTALPRNEPLAFATAPVLNSVNVVQPARVSELGAWPLTDASSSANSLEPSERYPLSSVPLWVSECR